MAVRLSLVASDGFATADGQLGRQLGEKLRLLNEVIAMSRILVAEILSELPASPGEGGIRRPHDIIGRRSRNPICKLDSVRKQTMLYGDKSR